MRRSPILPWVSQVVVLLLACGDAGHKGAGARDTGPTPPGAGATEDSVGEPADAGPTPCVSDVEAWFDCLDEYGEAPDGYGIPEGLCEDDPGNAHAAVFDCYREALVTGDCSTHAGVEAAVEAAALCQL